MTNAPSGHINPRCQYLQGSFIFAKQNLRKDLHKNQRFHSFITSLRVCLFVRKKNEGKVRFGWASPSVIHLFTHLCMIHVVEKRMIIVLDPEKSYVTLTQVSVLKSSEIARFLFSLAPQKFQRKITSMSPTTFIPKILQPTKYALKRKRTINWK